MRSTGPDSEDLDASPDSPPTSKKSRGRRKIQRDGSQSDGRFRSLESAKNRGSAGRKKRGLNGTAFGKTPKRRKPSDDFNSYAVSLHEEEPEYCAICQEGGEVICCDSPGCGKVYHIECVGLTSVPPNSWLCPDHPADTIIDLESPDCPQPIADEHMAGPAEPDDEADDDSVTPTPSPGPAEAGPSRTPTPTPTPPSSSRPRGRSHARANGLPGRPLGRKRGGASSSGRKRIRNPPAKSTRFAERKLAKYEAVLRWRHYPYNDDEEDEYIQERSITGMVYKILLRLRQEELKRNVDILDTKLRYVKERDDEVELTGREVFLDEEKRHQVMADRIGHLKEMFDDDTTNLLHSLNLSKNLVLIQGFAHNGLQFSLGGGADDMSSTCDVPESSATPVPAQAAGQPEPAKAAEDEPSQDEPPSESESESEPGSDEARLAKTGRRKSRRKMDTWWETGRGVKAHARSVRTSAQDPNLHETGPSQLGPSEPGSSLVNGCLNIQAQGTVGTPIPLVMPLKRRGRRPKNPRPPEFLLPEPSDEGSAVPFASTSAAATVASPVAQSSSAGAGTEAPAAKAGAGAPEPSGDAEVKGRLRTRGANRPYYGPVLFPVLRSDDPSNSGQRDVTLDSISLSDSDSSSSSDVSIPQRRKSKNQQKRKPREMPQPDGDGLCCMCYKTVDKDSLQWCEFTTCKRVFHRHCMRPEQDMYCPNHDVSVRCEDGDVEARPDDLTARSNKNFTRYEAEIRWSYCPHAKREDQLISQKSTTALFNSIIEALRDQELERGVDVLAKERLPHVKEVSKGEKLNGREGIFENKRLGRTWAVYADRLKHLVDLHRGTHGGLLRQMGLDPRMVEVYGYSHDGVRELISAANRTSAVPGTVKALRSSFNAHRHKDLQLDFDAEEGVLKGRSSDGIKVEGTSADEAPLEEVCFFCKDGGELLLCDFPECHKAFHQECIDLDVVPAEPWYCPLHDGPKRLSRKEYVSYEAKIHWKYYEHGTSTETQVFRSRAVVTLFHAILDSIRKQELKRGVDILTAKKITHVKELGKNERMHGREEVFVAKGGRRFAVYADRLSHLGAFHRGFNGGILSMLNLDPNLVEVLGVRDDGTSDVVTSSYRQCPSAAGLSMPSRASGVLLKGRMSTHRSLPPLSRVSDVDSNVPSPNSSSEPSRAPQTESLCGGCGGGGFLLYCSDPSCCKAYHLGCLNLLSAPKQYWKCMLHVSSDPSPPAHYDALSPAPNTTSELTFPPQLLLEPPPAPPDGSEDTALPNQLRSGSESEPEAQPSLARCGSKPEPQTEPDRPHGRGRRAAARAAASAIVKFRSESESESEPEPDDKEGAGMEDLAPALAGDRDRDGDGEDYVSDPGQSSGTAAPKTGSLLKRVAVMVLKRHGRPIRAKQLIETALQYDMLGFSRSRNPEACITVMMNKDIQEYQDNSTFIRVAPGTFGLRDFDCPIPVVEATSHHPRKRKSLKYLSSCLLDPLSPMSTSQPQPSPASTKSTHAASDTLALCPPAPGPGASVAGPSDVPVEQAVTTPWQFEGWFTQDEGCVELAGGCSVRTCSDLACRFRHHPLIGDLNFWICIGCFTQVQRKLDSARRWEYLTVQETSASGTVVERQQLCTVCAHMRNTCTLHPCSTCPRSFCEQCMDHIYGPTAPKRMQSNPSWRCPLCLSGIGPPASTAPSPSTTVPDKGGTSGTAESLPIISTGTVLFLQYVLALNQKETAASDFGLDGAEANCFICKDGGSLIICDYPSCAKVFHQTCLGLLQVPPGKWHCPWHHCSLCLPPSIIYPSSTNSGSASPSPSPTMQAPPAPPPPYRCRTCPAAFCENHLPENVLQVGEYIQCASCIRHLQELTVLDTSE